MRSPFTRHTCTWIDRPAHLLKAKKSTTTPDTYTQTGGNEKLLQFLQQHGVAKSTPIAQKYQTPAAELYRERLRALVEGRDPPTELPKRAPAPAPMMAPHQAPTSSGGPGGFGGPALASGGGGHAGSALEPLPGEGQEQYVARQRRLNEEARRRMQAKFGGGGAGGGGARMQMQGFGSDPDYDPNRGAFGGGGGGGDLAAEVFGAVGRIGSTVQVCMWVM